MGGAFDDFLESLPIWPTTRRLVACLLWDSPLTPASRIDFGVDEPDQYRALRAVLFNGPMPDENELDELQTLEDLRQRILELNAASGNGPMLDALVHKYAPEYAGQVHFQTFWDVLYGRVKAEEQ